MSSDNTPMMQQYLRIKEQYRDAVLFFRLGDFYEMFKSDAREVSQILGITLTRRHGIEMCGIPYHAAQNYIHRLLKAGKKIAVCEQTEMPKKGQKIAKREVVEIITPGTVTDQNYLSDKSNNYLAALGRWKKSLSLAYIDLSTGDFRAMSIPDDRIDILRQEIYRLSIKELIVQESLIEEKDFSFILDYSFFINRYPDWYFDKETSLNRIKSQFNVAGIKGFGFRDDDPEIISSGVLLEYIQETAKTLLPHITTLQKHTEKGLVSLDEATRKNLELTRNLQDGSDSFTLLEILDETKTSMGGRNISQWIQQPLFDRTIILERQKRVDFFYHNQVLLSEIREHLSQILDMERLAARLAMDKAHAKDLLSLKISLVQLQNLCTLLQEEGIDLFETLLEDSKLLEAPLGIIEESIMEDPSILLTEGRMIREGFHKDVDKFRRLKSHSKEILDNYLQEIKTQTGIVNIRIKYNKIIGYFFEVSKSQVNMVPDDFIRRQSLVNGERFTTNRLIDIETDINSSSDRLVELERELFLSIRNQIKAFIPTILRAAANIARLDTFQSFAYTATIRGYIRPEISEDRQILIKEGRHPVVENHIPPGEFIPNDLVLERGSEPFLLVTGPNMAGKSTYLRQIALLTLMAQTGSYIPAAEAVIGMVDRIFCRVGASDNLARGWFSAR